VANGVPKDPRIGSVVNGRYEILRHIAEGAMGAVYEGVRVHIERPVAVKFLHRAYLRNEDSRRRFEREAIAMSKLSHPNCVSVLDFGFEEGVYIVMDLVRGATLRELIDRDELTPERSVRIMAQMLSGLGHAHEQQLVHRDVKPANVMVQSDAAGNDYVRVLDFGLVKLNDPDADPLTEEGIVAGTTVYMSPEHAFGSGIDARSDLYSAAVVFFEMLTGKPPFDAETAAGLLLMHRDKTPPRLLERCEGENPPSRALEHVLDQALAKAKEDRFQSAAEFIEALATVPEAGGSASDLTRVSLQSMAPQAAPKTPGAALARLLRGALGSVGIRTRAGRRRALFTAAVAGIGLPLLLAVAPRWGAGDAAADGVAAPRAAAPSLPPAAAAAPDAGPGPLAKGAAKLAPADPAGAAQAELLLMRGELEVARRLLLRLLETDPQNPELHYLLGTSYFESRRWDDGIASYAAALHFDPEYRSRALLSRNVVRGLRSGRTHDAARALIVDALRDDALPHLRHEYEHAYDNGLRRRLAALLTELGADAAITANMPPAAAAHPSAPKAHPRTDAAIADAASDRPAATDQAAP